MIDKVEKKIETIIMAEEVKKLLRYLYAEQLRLGYRSMIEIRCDGCKIDHPSQKQHICLDPSENEAFLTYELYDAAEMALDKQYLELVFIETANTLGLNHSLVDFESSIQDYLQHWEATGFQDVEKSLEVEESFTMARTIATMKLLSLEERCRKQ